MGPGLNDVEGRRGSRRPDDLLLVHDGNGRHQLVGLGPLSNASGEGRADDPARGRGSAPRHAPSPPVVDGEPRAVADSWQVDRVPGTQPGGRDISDGRCRRPLEARELLAPIQTPDGDGERDAEEDDRHGRGGHDGDENPPPHRASSR